MDTHARFERRVSVIVTIKTIILLFILCLIHRFFYKAQILFIFVVLNRFATSEFRLPEKFSDKHKFFSDERHTKRWVGEGGCPLPPSSYAAIACCEDTMHEMKQTRTVSYDIYQIFPLLLLIAAILT
jgi:hypothetical protein